MQRFYALIVGIVFIGIGVFLYVNNNNLKKNCTKEAEATVVDMEEEFSSDPDSASSYLYYPVIEYSAGEKTVKEKMSSGSSTPAYKLGEKVTILYNPNKVNEFIVKGEKATGIISYIIIGVGAVVTVCGIVMAIKPNKQENE